MQKPTEKHSTYLHSLWTASTSLVQTGESPHRFVVRWSAADGNAGHSHLLRCYLWRPQKKSWLISTLFHWELVTDLGSLPPWWWGLVSLGSLILRCGRPLLRWRWPHPPLWRVRWVGGAPSRCRTRRVSFSGSTRSKGAGCGRVSAKYENAVSTIDQAFGDLFWQVDSEDLPKLEFLCYSKNFIRFLKSYTSFSVEQGHNSPIYDQCQTQSAQVWVLPCKTGSPRQLKWYPTTKIWVSLYCGLRINQDNPNPQ